MTSPPEATEPLAPYARIVWMAEATRHGDPRPLWVQPTLRNSRALITGRAIAHPFGVVGAALRGASLREIASALLLRQGASALETQVIESPDGTRHPISRLCTGASPRTQHPKPHVAGLLIAQNEEEIIGDAIASFGSLVDEVLVVDGGSEDATVDIARAAGARVVHRTFDRDFAAQRNTGIDALRSPWIISIDADERISDELRTLLDVILRRVGRADTVHVPLLSLVGDDLTPTQWPDVQPRLFRGHLRYSGVIHEKLQWRRPIYLPANGPYIRHYKSLLRHYRNSLRYSEIDASPYSEDYLEWLRAETARLQSSSDRAPRREG